MMRRVDTDGRGNKSKDKRKAIDLSTFRGWKAALHCHGRLDYVYYFTCTWKVPTRRRKEFPQERRDFVGPGHWRSWEFGLKLLAASEMVGMGCQRHIYSD